MMNGASLEMLRTPMRTVAGSAADAGWYEPGREHSASAESATNERRAIRMAGPSLGPEYLPATARGFVIGGRLMLLVRRISFVLALCGLLAAGVVAPSRAAETLDID